MKILLIMLLLSLSLTTAQAEPLRLEAQAGVCEHGLAANGIWHNDSMPTDIDLRSTCWSFGVSQAPWKYRGFDLGWRLAYVDLGRYKADNVFAMRDDEQFTGVTGDDCEADSGKGCLGRGRISGRTRGVSIGALAEWPVSVVTLGLETGVYAYYNRFTVTISAHPDASKFQPVTVTWGDIHATPYLGTTARYKYLFATARIYGHVRAGEHNCGGCSGITHGPAWQLTAGIQVPF